MIGSLALSLSLFILLVGCFRVVGMVHSTSANQIQHMTHMFVVRHNVYCVSVTVDALHTGLHGPHIDHMWIYDV